MYDVVIIGMGPAGLTAAVYAARKKMSTLMIGKEYGGQVSRTSEVENYMGYQYISGPELISKFEEQVRSYQVEQRQGEVIAVERQNNHFVSVSSEGDRYLSKTLVVAAGKFPRRLNIPGEDRLTGRGVSYCAVCDAPLFGNKKVAVVGGGNSAVEAAIDLTKIVSQVYVISLKEWIADAALVDKVKGAHNLTKMVGWNIERIDGQDAVESITISKVDGGTGEKKKLAVDGVFIEIGTVPNSRFVEGFLELNENEEIVVDCDCSTSVPGVFAAGDITNIPEKQVIVAAGEGAKAALGAYKYLLATEPPAKRCF